jgi:hypothetical protein
LRQHVKVVQAVGFGLSCLADRPQKESQMTRSLARGLSLILLAVALLGMSAPAAATGTTARANVVTAACTIGSSTCPIRIAFRPGAYSGQGTSWLSGLSSSKWFVVRARAGQTMIVIVKGAGATRGIVYFPNGHHEGQPGGRVFDGLLPRSGDYRIRVSESLMGSAWSGRVDVLVVIY